MRCVAVQRCGAAWWWLMRPGHQSSLEAYLRMWAEDTEHRPKFYERKALIWDLERMDLLVCHLPSLHPRPVVAEQRTGHGAVRP